MNNRNRVEMMLGKLNQMTLGTDKVEWNTPLSFHLTSSKPGTRRIYSVERNKPEGSGVEVWWSGYSDEVYRYVAGLLDGTKLAGVSK